MRNNPLNTAFTPPPHEFNLEYNPKSRLHECSALVKLLVLQPHTKEINRTVRAQLIKHSVLEDFQPPDWEVIHNKVPCDGHIMLLGLLDNSLLTGFSSIQRNPHALCQQDNKKRMNSSPLLLGRRKMCSHYSNKDARLTERVVFKQSLPDFFLISLLWWHKLPLHRINRISPWIIPTTAAQFYFSLSPSRSGKGRSHRWPWSNFPIKEWISAISSTRNLRN